MITCKTFLQKKNEGKVEFERNGVVPTLTLPSTEKVTNRYTLEVEDGEINLTATDKGKVTLLVERLGVVEGKDNEVEVTALFVDGGMLVQVDKGKVAIEVADNGVVFVDAKGEITYPDEGQRQFVKWLEEKDIKTLLGYAVKTRYNTPTLEDAGIYLDNFLVSFLLHHYRPNEQNISPIPVLRTLPITFDEVLGNGVFDFDMYKKEKQSKTKEEREIDKEFEGIF